MITNTPFQLYDRHCFLLKYNNKYITSHSSFVEL